MNVFAYGSLVVPDVMQVVTGRAHEHVRARLPAFARHVLIGRVYPGIVPDAASAVDGRLYFDVKEDELHRLDWWEDEEYDRESVEVEVEVVGDADGGAVAAVSEKAESGQRIVAWTYVIAPEHRVLVGETPWDEVRFVEENLADFLAHTRVVIGRYTDESS